MEIGDSQPPERLAGWTMFLRDGWENGLLTPQSERLMDMSTALLFCVCGGFKNVKVRKRISTTYIDLHKDVVPGTKVD
jgi:hypothetical protein